MKSSLSSAYNYHLNARRPRGLAALCSGLRRRGIFAVIKRNGRELGNKGPLLRAARVMGVARGMEVT